MISHWSERWAPSAGVIAVTMALGACGGGSVEADDTSVSVEEGSPTAMPPWPAPTEDVEQLVSRAGLDLGPMGTAEHYHPKLRIVVDGEQIPVPPNIGVDPNTGAMSAVHTHEGDGTVHVEATRDGETFTLGQLFAQWNVLLEDGRIGGIAGDDKLSMTVNGRPVAGDPADLRLRPDQQIVLEAS